MEEPGVCSTFYWQPGGRVSQGGGRGAVLTSDTEPAAAAQTSEVDRAAIPMRLAVRCQYPGQWSSLTTGTNLKLGKNKIEEVVMLTRTSAYELALPPGVRGL